MKITIDTDKYNHRRYKRPWIAKVDFSQSTKGDLTFGDWVGSHGGEGVLAIDVLAGDIVARGQKDLRGRSEMQFFVVQSSGELGLLGDKGAAYKHYLSHDTAPDLDALKKKRAELLARIAEIDKALGQ